MMTLWSARSMARCPSGVQELHRAQHTELAEQARRQRRLELPHDAHWAVTFGRLPQHASAGPVGVILARAHEQLELPPISWAREVPASAHGIRAHAVLTL